MPRYDFTCLNCETTIEIEKSFSDDSRPSCPTCGEFMNKVYSSPGAIFRGSGWGGQ